MEPIRPEGEFHHFQLINQEGEIPFSVSVLVHYNQRKGQPQANLEPLGANDVIAFHDQVEQFDGDFAKAFAKK